MRIPVPVGATAGPRPTVTTTTSAQHGQRAKSPQGEEESRPLSALCALGLAERCSVAPTPQVAQVVLDGSPQRLVDLHLTPHHTILSYSSSHSSHSNGDSTITAAPHDASEIWIAHSVLLSIHLHATIRDGAARTPLVIRSRSFDSHTILFSKRQDARLVYESLEAVVARRGEAGPRARVRLVDGRAMSGPSDVARS